jgi:hypothetical protein
MVMPPATASKRSYNDNRTSTEEPHVSIMLAAHYCLRRSSLDRCNALIELSDVSTSAWPQKQECPPGGP